MTAPDVILASDVRINGVSTLGKMKLRYFSQKGPVYPSNASSGAIRKCGNIGFTGMYMAYGHTPPVWLDTVFTFTATLEDETTVYGSAKCKRVEVFSIPEPQGDDDRYVYYVVHFVSNGAALQFGTGAIGDTSSPALFCSSGLTVTLDDTAEPNVLWMHLMAQSSGKPYVNSSTNGYYKWPDGNTDWEFTYRRHINSLTLLPTIDSLKRVRMAVTSVLNWDLQWGIVSEPFDIETENTQEESIFATVKLEMTGCNGTDTGGFIKNPAGATLWPS